MVALGQDVHSYANYEQVKVQHIALEWNVDFDRKQLHGFADIKANVISENAQQLLLDTKGLAIQSVEDLDDKHAKVLYTMPQHHPALGVCLSLPLSKDRSSKGSTVNFRVHYTTTAESGGIQWLEAQQTASKKYPFTYTQFEAILARSCLPCQDTPAVKHTYSARVIVPSPLVAVCSGLSVGEPQKLEDGKLIAYNYVQNVPIPSYLIAMGCGALEKGKIGPRSSVWSEKERLDAAIYEFSEHTEKFIQVGEKITGIPYEWGQYDLLVLPKAFPYGGMENPNLTFISASLLAGDRSLTDVVAHEIAHSWAGNLVTNCCWGDFWLNEGFTMYMERLILGEIHGSEQHRQFEALCGYNDLIKAVDELQDVPEFTKLQPNMEDIDPDDAFSRIPYEKGFLFIFYLEQVVGGVEVMKGWLQKYFKDFSMKSLSTDQMKEHFLSYFTDKIDKSKLDSIDWETWLHGVGLPSFDPNTVIDKTLSQKCQDLTAKWKSGQVADCSKQDVANLTPQQIMYFLDSLITTAVPMDHEVLSKLDSCYKFDAYTNVEIAFRWLMLCLKSGYKQAFGQVEAFLGQHGRGIYLRPMYKTLHELDHAEAVRIYQANRCFYHSVIRNTFDQLLAA